MSSTFAWYAATSAAGVTTDSTDKELGNLSTTQERSAGDLKVEFTITDKGGRLTGDGDAINVDHTDSSGTVKYLVNGTPTEASGGNGFGTVYSTGRLVISVNWSAAALADLEARKAAGKDGNNTTKDYTFQLTPAGMVVLMDASGFTAGTDAPSYSEADADQSLDVKITVDSSDGSVEMKSGYSTFYYAIRTNNTAGAEDTSSITTANFTAFDTSSAAVVADSMVSSGGHYYITQTTFAQGTSFDATKCVEAALHTADAVNIA